MLSFFVALIVLLCCSWSCIAAEQVQSFQLPNLNHRFSYASYPSTEVQPLTETDLTETENCSFRGVGVNCSSEYVEYQILKQFLRPTDVVLDVGARYGMTSCLIASLQGNNGQLLAVEPDSRVWKALEENRESHHCSMWTLRGVVGTTPYALQLLGDGNARALALALGNKASLRGSVSIPEEELAGRDYFSLRDVQVITGLTFNTLHLDCEGCIDSFFKATNNQYGLDRLLQNIRLIILEADMGIGTPECQEKCVDYNLWIMRFQELGYSVEVKLADPDYSWKHHYVLVRKDLAVPLSSPPTSVSVFDTLKDSLED